jgi:hypothetical protein
MMEQAVGGLLGGELAERKTWRHLNFFQHQAYLTARVPRVRCDKCGIKTINVPWARPDSGFTLLFEAMLMAMIPAMPVAAVARMVGEHDTGCGGSCIIMSTRDGSGRTCRASPAWRSMRPPRA